MPLRENNSFFFHDGGAIILSFRICSSFSNIFCFVKKLFFSEQIMVLFDMRLADFMVGCWKSTLTESVCFWRGWEKRTKSNMCYIQDRWANVERRGGFF